MGQFFLKATGNVTIDAGGKIIADGKGFAAASGPGAGTSGGGGAGGAGYGAKGGDGDVPGGPAYGNQQTPASLGSGGGTWSGTFSSHPGGAGGGLIHIEVGGTLSIAGTISASGMPGTGAEGEGAGGGGSGGTIFLKAGTLILSNTISARGGAGGHSPAAPVPFATDVNGGGGAGGRIAIIYGTFQNHGGKFDVSGGKGKNTGGLGTVFAKQVSAVSITVTPPADQSAIKGIATNVKLGSFAQTNATAPFKVDINWGDGTADTILTLNNAGAIPTTSHSFAKAGLLTVSETVTDANATKSNIATFHETVALPPSTGSIAGNVFSDINANGKLDAGEKGLPAVTVFIDANKNGKLDSNETKLSTDSQGNFKFAGLVPASYRVAEVVPTGFKLIAPASEHFDETVISGGAITGLLFADAPATASIRGRVFGDGNGDGTRNPGEVGLGLWQVFIDYNNDGKIDGSDVSVTTDVNGNWSFSGLVAGSYTVRVVQVAGTVATKPTGGVMTIKLTAGQASVGNLFGEKSIN